MSQEQPQIRSRRELRKAREAQQPATPESEQIQPAADHTAGRAPATAGPEAAGSAGAASPPRAQPAPEQPSTQRSSQIRARDRAALRTLKELEEKEGQLSAGGPPTRRQLRLQQLKEQALTAANPVVPSAAPPAPAPEAGSSAAATKAPEPPAEAPLGAPDGMTVEQALEARALIAAQAGNQTSKVEQSASPDPEAVDPEDLAEQIALAERAAVLNRRAMARQKLAEQAGTPAAPARPVVPADKPGPSTANNLAMVTPLEFVQVPGVDRPVMKPPATSHVPVTTRPGTKLPGAGKRKTPARTKPSAADSATGRSQVIARAEAAAKAATRPKPAARPASLTEAPSEDLFEDLPRVPARSAYGLDPLDAATAGLTRARRNRVLQFCVLAFGILALIAGIILIVSGMSR
ncbi:hypothetical protein [Pseudarthrobacter sp. NPDC080039]|uniref:hypothetical protein n=1 Tax=unclassified Pseudarthrobacter TaxID=2647000 RepID=UPI00344EE79D